MSAYNHTSDTVSLAGLAKEIYPVNEIKDMEQKVTAFKKEVKEETELTFSPAQDGSFIFPIKAYGAHGQRMINQKETLPYGKPSNVVQGRSFIKEYAGVIEFTKRELTLAKKGAQAFADVKTFEMESLIENAHKYFNRQMANGNGLGTMTLVLGNQAAAQTVIEVDDATPFQIGMVLDMFNAAGTVKQADSVIVQDIDILSTPMSITLTEGLVIQVDDNGIICLAGVRDNMSADGKEMIGIPLAIDDGTLATSFQGIVRSGVGEVPNYRGISVDALGAPLSVGLIAQLMTRAFRIGGIQFDQLSDVYWLISPEQWRAYASEAIPQIRFSPTDPLDLAKGYGGGAAYEMAGKRVVMDTDVARDRAYLIKKDAVKMAVAAPLDWEDELGGTTLKWLSGTPQGIMVLYALMQFFVSDVRSLAGITNLSAVPI